MLRTIRTSVTAMQAASSKMDQISLNISNLGTSGYKRGAVEFKDLVYETMNRKGYPVSANTTGANMSTNGTGVVSTTSIMDNTEGELELTGYKSDISISGRGYIRVKDGNNNTLYARVGSFAVDAKGRLTDSNQNILDIRFENGKTYDNANFTQDNYTIKEDGQVLISDKNGNTTVGHLDIYDAIGDNAFRYLGGGLYAPASDATVYRTTSSKIVQGSVESSNVAMEQEEADMITTQRAFQLASKSLQTADEMLGMANNLRK